MFMATGKLEHSASLAEVSYIDIVTQAHNFGGAVVGTPVFPCDEVLGLPKQKRGALYHRSMTSSGCLVSGIIQCQTYKRVPSHRDFCLAVSAEGGLPEPYP
jgi:hypothetical protein